MFNDDLAYLNNHRYPRKPLTKAEKLAAAKEKLAAAKEWLANAKEDVKRAKALVAKLGGK